MTICAALSTGLSAQSIYPGQHAGKMKKVTTAPIQVESDHSIAQRTIPYNILRTILLIFLRADGASLCLSLAVRSWTDLTARADAVILPARSDK